jgi:hypothetical protein
MSLSNLNVCNNELLFIDHLNSNVIDSVCGDAKLAIGQTGASSVWIGGQTTPVYINNTLVGSSGPVGPTGPTGPAGAIISQTFSGNVFNSGPTGFTGVCVATLQGSLASLTIGTLPHQMVGNNVFTSTFTTYAPHTRRYGVVSARNNSNFQYCTVQVDTSGIVTVGTGLDITTLDLIAFAGGDNTLYDSTFSYYL